MTKKNPSDALRIAGAILSGPDRSDLSPAEAAAVEVEHYRDLEGAWQPISRSDLTTRDATRYVFKDGSAIVAIGDWWDLEGPDICSWEGEE